jgi:hypothetical protein
MTHSVDQHFERRSPTVRKVYDAIVAAASELGTVIEDPKKTSIHLVRRTAFAGVATQKEKVVLTLKLPADLRSKRVHKHEQASAHRWHVELRVDDPAQVDGELKGWLKQAWEISG